MLLLLFWVWWEIIPSLVSLAILVGVNNRVFTNLLNIIQITRNFRKMLRHRFQYPRSGWHKIWNSLQKLTTPGWGKSENNEIESIIIQYKVKIWMSGNIWYLHILENNLCRLQKPHVFAKLFVVWHVYEHRICVTIIQVDKVGKLSKPLCNLIRDDATEKKHISVTLFDPFHPMVHGAMLHPSLTCYSRKHQNCRNYFCRGEVCKTLSSAFLSILWV